jgi:maltooligosyltrehalose trehalohydrolase
MLLCLSPYPVLLFMGQDWASTSPFLFFSDHGGEVGAAVTAGRSREFHGHAGDGTLPDPEAASTFEASKLRWEERDEDPHASVRELYRYCLRERQELSREGALARGQWCVFTFHSLVAIRYEVPGAERMLLFALDGSRIREHELPASISAGRDAEWRIILGSESEQFGGRGHATGDGGWAIAGPAALWLEVSMKGAAHAP